MANNPYVNKVVFGNNTVMDISGDTATPSDVLKGETFHDKSGALQVGTLSLDEFATIDLLKDTVGWTGKNLLVYPYITNSGTVQSVSYIVNNDGTIVLNNTASANGEIAFHNRSGVVDDNPIILPAGNYILTKEDSDVYVDLLHTVSGARAQLLHLGINAQSASFTLTQTEQIGVVIGFDSGKIFSNTVIKPMLRKSSITDDTYEPYHESVEQCKFDRSEQRVLGAKNLLPYPYLNSTRTENGITFTDNGNGSITISGVATDQVLFVLFSQLADGMREKLLALKDLSISGGLSNRVKLNFWNANADNNSSTDIGQGANISFTNTNANFNFVISIDNGTDLTTPVTIYPMLRLASDPDDTYVPYAMTNRELTDSLDGWTATSQVANEQVTFTGLDDTQGWGYDPRIWIDDNSTNLNPYCKINSMTGAGTANMSITYDTDADNGAYVRLRIIR